MALKVFDLDVNTVLVLGLAIAALLYATYLAALPNVLPGIPYNEKSANKIFGDVSLMMGATYRRQWIWSQPKIHQAPVSQVFMFPFRKPTVIVSDYREVVDICSRRLKEFDRGPRNRECVGVTAPNFHFTMDSRDPSFKFHKELIRDLMTPRFLREVSGPRVYNRFSTLIDLWDLKTKKADGRPFSAGRDLHLATLDMISSVAFGMEEAKTALRFEIDHVRSLSPDAFRSLHEPFHFPPARTDPEIEALLDIPEMMSIAQRSPFPYLAQRLALLNPRHTRAQWIRRALMKRQIDRSVRKLALSGLTGCETALDLLLWREINAAKKADRNPDFYSPAIRDEVLGYLLAGHDTTATTMSWWIKYMTTHQTVQDRLRQELRQAHSSAAQEGRWPSTEEISNTSISYLDAVLEETLRYASVATLIVRRATCDTQILGCHIPKGVDIILPLTGPSITEPALSIPEDLRSSESMRTKDRIPYWKGGEHHFIPERWLKHTCKEDGTETEVFDPYSGPNLAFSSGPRQCFGKKLAYLKLRVMVTLLIWNFHFEPLDESLNGSDITERMVNLPKDCYVKLTRVI